MSDSVSAQGECDALHFAFIQKHSTTDTNDHDIDSIIVYESDSMTKVGSTGLHIIAHHLKKILTPQLDCTLSLII